MMCFCHSKKPYSTCCQPLHDSLEGPTAEKVMRSRYSAYCLNKWQYIVDTYSAEKRENITSETIAASANGDIWVHLKVVSPVVSVPNKVEFYAYYKHNSQLYVLHETSSFVQEPNGWRYHEGNLHEDTGKIDIGRNSSCVCDSGKKYKQCCLKKSVSG